MGVVYGVYCTIGVFFTSYPSLDSISIFCPFSGLVLVVLTLVDK